VTGICILASGLNLALLSFAVLVSVLNSAQSPKNAAQVSTAKAADNSKEAIVIERYVTHTSYEADGSGTREITAVVHVQAEAGVQTFAVLAFPYTSADESVDVDYVRVRKPDGAVVVTPEYNVQDLPAEVTRQAPMYSDIHEKHVMVKALGVGDTLEYLVRYRIVKPQVPGQFWFEHSFFKDTIVKDEELEISVPREKYVKVSSPDLQPQTKDDGPRRIYSWKTANLERKDDDKKLTKQEEEPKPSVQLTTFHNWEEVGSWYAGLQQPQQAITPAISAKAAELTKGLSNDDDKIRALYNFVSTHFHYISLSFGIGRYQPHAADDVLGNEYGDCKDKHTLLAALLQAAGYDAWPALINSSRKVDPDLPSPGQFDHVITVVPRGSNSIWLDTTPEVSPFGLLLAGLRDKQALVIPSGKPAFLMRTPEAPPFPSSQDFHAEAKLGPDGTLTGHMKYSFRGDVEVLFRLSFRKVSQAQWKDLVQRMSYSTGFGGEVSAVNASAPDDTEKPFQFEYDYTRKDYGDWENRRIGPPFPRLGIEVWKDVEEKPKEPVFLGAPGKIEYRARVELPFEALHIPEDVNLVQDFAEYHSTYTVEKGVLTAVRQFTIKKKDVPLAAWEDYRKFCKAIADDEDRMIQLEGERVNIAPPTGHNSGADQKFEEASQAYERHDVTATQEAIRRVLELDPKYPHAHAMLGVTYLMQNNIDVGIEELRKEEEVNPSDPISYQTLTPILARMHRTDEAMEQWRKLLQVDPKNRDAAINLSRMLGQAQKYSEAVEILETALKQAPDSTSLQFALSFAYIRGGQKEKGLGMLQQTIANAPADSMLLNDAAYSLAEANVGLDRAKEYAEKSSHQLEEASNKIDASDDQLLATTRDLAAVWDTVGWVYFRQDNLEKANAYLSASWNLSQDPVVGDHLAQIYERQGKKNEAAHLYELAIASHGRNNNEAQQHYEHLTGKKATSASMLGGELSNMRTVRLPATAHHKMGNAMFDLVFSPGKLEEVKYVSGDEVLKPMADLLKAAKFNVEFPDENPTRLVRRGMLACSAISGCNFVLLPPDSAHAAD
jgi:tetratricopeptide (TPR) repeat protein/transglutaminase-like putative cysteine protease